MLFFYLVLIYGACSISLNMFDPSLQQNTFGSGNLLLQIKANPNKFLAQLQNLDPEVLREVLVLLEGLLESSETRETNLRGELTSANTALDNADTAVVNAEDVLTAAKEAETTAEQAVTAAQTDLEHKKTDRVGKKSAKKLAQDNQDEELPGLDNDQRVLREVIAAIKGLIPTEVPTEAAGEGPEWLEIADVAGDQATNAAFWNSKCGDFAELAPGDTILLRMGEVKDYFHPKSRMSLCDFLVTVDGRYTWSPTEDGNFVDPGTYSTNYGGSSVSGIPGDGRNWVSMWGFPGSTQHGGCCYFTSDNYGNGADSSQWNRAFTMFIKRQAPTQAPTQFPTQFPTLAPSLAPTQDRSPGPEWLEIADVASDETTNAAFWNSKCGDFAEVAPADTILVHMGEVKDYFQPISRMSLCDFLLEGGGYTWSQTEDGNFVVPSYYLRGHYGGSNGGGFPGDGRNFISMWGKVDSSHTGGCCYYKSDIYGNGPDSSQWNRAFTMYIKRGQDFFSDCATESTTSDPVPSGYMRISTMTCDQAGYDEWIQKGDNLVNQCYDCEGDWPYAMSLEDSIGCHPFDTHSASPELTLRNFISWKVPQCSQFVYSDVISHVMEETMPGRALFVHPAQRWLRSEIQCSNLHGYDYVDIPVSQCNA